MIRAPDGNPDNARAGGRARARKPQVQQELSPIPARPNKIVHLFMNGGPQPSTRVTPKRPFNKYQCAKPATQTRPLPTERKQGGAKMRRQFNFHPDGESGIGVSRSCSSRRPRHRYRHVLDRSMHFRLSPIQRTVTVLMNCVKIFSPHSRASGRGTRPRNPAQRQFGLGRVLCPQRGARSGFRIGIPGFLPGAMQDAYHTRQSGLFQLIEKHPHPAGPPDVQRRPARICCNR